MIDGISKAARTLKDNHNTSEVHIKGCSHLLQLWALEHTMVVKRPVDLWPRILKWPSKNMATKYARAILDVNVVAQVVVELIPTLDETNIPAIRELLEMDVHSSGHLTPPPPPSPQIMHEQVDPNYLTTPSDEPDTGIAGSPHHNCKFEYGLLRASYESLQTEYGSKIQHFDDLLSHHNSLKTSYATKCEAYDALFDKFKVLHAQHYSVQEELTKKCSVYDELLQQYNELLAAQQSILAASQPAARTDMATPSPIASPSLNAVESSPPNDDDDEIQFLYERTPTIQSHPKPPSNTVAARLKRNPRKRAPGRQLTSPWTSLKPRGRATVLGKSLGEPASSPSDLEQWIVSYVHYNLSPSQQEEIASNIKFDFESLPFGRKKVGSGDCEIDFKFLEPLVYKCKENTKKKWLSTEVVDAYLAILREREGSSSNWANRNFFVSSYASGRVISQDCCPTEDLSRSFLRRLGDHDQVIFPIIHDGYWMLIACNRHHRTIFWFDSYPMRSNNSIRDKLVAWMFAVVVRGRWKVVDADNWQVEYVDDIPKQLENMDDCGVYMLTYVVCIASVGRIMQFSRESIQNIRYRLFLELQSGSFLQPNSGTACN